MVLELPSPTATATRQPTATPTVGTPGDLCGTEAPGTLCRKPPPTPLPPTPYPDCASLATVAPGDWCVWGDATPEADR